MTSLDTATTPRRYGHFIAGDWREATETIARYAPGTGALVTEVAAGDVADVDAAVRAAREAFDSGPWPRATGFERAALLHKVADLIDANAALLARLDAEEGGKPIRLAEGDIAGAAMLTRYAAGLAVQMHGSPPTPTTAPTSPGWCCASRPASPG